MYLDDHSNKPTVLQTLLDVWLINFWWYYFLKHKTNLHFCLHHTICIDFIYKIRPIFVLRWMNWKQLSVYGGVKHWNSKSVHTLSPSLASLSVIRKNWKNTPASHHGPCQLTCKKHHALSFINLLSTTSICIMEKNDTKRFGSVNKI
jgi:hypothetical protein